MREYDREFIASTIRKLVPGAKVDVEYVPTFDAHAKYVVKASDMRSGFFRDEKHIVIWADIDAGSTILFKLSRNGITFTSREKKFLKFVPDVLEHTLPIGESEAQQMHRLSGRLVLGTAIVAKFLHNKLGEGFWGPAFVLSLLQLLLSQNYEGVNATSGFVVIPKVNQLFSQAVQKHFDVKLLTRRSDCQRVFSPNQFHIATLMVEMHSTYSIDSRMCTGF
ncbi:MAG: hypothetical protein RDA78_08575 [Roseibium sp.]|uniref:hypothetical protein n=1 Tax=Roseibium sp. TaxID=1936156 RepID=UPI003D9C1BCE